jgi:cytoskeletal protein RodZ
MSTVAELLRQGREAKQLTIEQVAQVTKMRSDHLRALEGGDFNVFSAPVYIRGFVRTYATLLKLDVPQVMAALDAELGQTQKFSEPPPLSSAPKGVLDFLTLQLSKINWQKGALILVGVVVLGVMLAIYAALRHQKTADPLKGLKPGVYHSTQHISGDTLPLPAPAPKR